VILDILTRLSEMMWASPWVAVSGALLWGIASVILSPCHLASVPLVMGFVAKQSGGTPVRAFVLSAVFSFGILVSMVVLGLITGMLGRIFGDVGPWSNWLGALIFALVGLLLLDVIHIPAYTLSSQERFKGRGLGAALLLGGLFGTVLGPCAFAFIMPVLGLVFDSVATRPLLATGLVLAYALGHCSVIVFAGMASTWILPIFHVRGMGRWIVWARKAVGVLAFAGAIWFLTK
jgi:cytochrome c-type biogenesis protein